MIDLLKLILENNEFTFNEKTYRQKIGVPMGGTASAELADIRMYDILKDIIQRFEHKNNITFCARYRDDGIMYFDGTEEQIHAFFQTANLAHEHLKFTYELSKSNINFLDLIIYKGERFENTGIFDVKTYIKPTETFQYLERTSSHPKHVFKAFVKGEIIRYIRNTNNKTELLKQVEAFKKRLIARNYSEEEINHIIENTINLDRRNLLHKSTKTKEKPLVMITKYNPASKQLRSKIKKHWKLIQQNEQCAKLFKKKPILAFKRNKNLQEKLSNNQ